MTDERLFERLAAHAGPVDVDPGFEDRLYALLQQEMPRSNRLARPVLLLVAALLVALAVGGAALVLSGIVEPPAPTDSSLTWTSVAIDERLLAPPDPGSFDLRSTTRLVWLGDRFVLADRGTISTSTDGSAWQLTDESDPSWVSYRAIAVPFEISTWENAAVTWAPQSTRSSVSVLRPPDQPVTKDFEGRVGTAGIGPLGIVAHVHSALDFDAYVTSVLGPGWVEHMVTFSFEDGILRITTDDDRALEVEWAAEGFEPGDVADRGFGWYSADGDEWTPIPDFPANVSEIVGVSDGFIARGFDGRCDGCADTDPYAMWHSPDGLTWRRIGPATDGSVLPWGQEVLVADGAGRFDVWTAEGSTVLPMAAELPAGWPAQAFGSGPLGLVSVNPDSGEVLFTNNGVDWTIQPMSEEMAAAAGPGRTPSTNVAVGRDSVVVLLWTGELESAVPSLWVGK
jgi:hypothetical protein